MPASETAADLEFERLARDRIKTGSWLDAQQFAPLEWIVPGLLPEGLSILAAAPKTGKSWFAAGVGLACASGGLALGHIPVERRPVLYAALEDGYRRLQSRYRVLLGDGARIPSGMNSLTDAGTLQELISYCEYFQDVTATDNRPPLIIIDTLGRVSPGRSGSQSQYEADYATGARLQALAKRVPGSSVMVVHHTNKSVHADFLNSVSGTQGVAGAYDAVLVLQRDRKSRDAVLAVTGRDIENETEYALHSDGGRWQLVGGNLEASERAVEAMRAEDRAEGLGDVKRTIMQLVSDLDEGDAASPAEIALKLGLDSKAIGTRLGELERAGLVVKVGRGRYAPSSHTL